MRSTIVMAVVCVVGLGIASTNLLAVVPIPPPSAVPGKEYSNHVDENALGVGDYLQNIHWDGLGGATDTFDYTGSDQPPWNAPQDPDMVDALANHQDYLYQPVISNQVPFLTSFSGIAFTSFGLPA